MRAPQPCALVAALALVVAAPACLYPPVPEVFEGGAFPDDGGVDPEGGEPIPEFNNCTVAMYVDRSDDGASREVDFGSNGGAPEFGYSPPCMIVAAGQTVTFAGDFSTHPLCPGTGPAARNAGSPDTPIPITASGMTRDVTFTTPGTYPYYCIMHYASGMVGAIHVR